MNEKKIIKQGRVFRFVEERYTLPDGRPASIDKVEHPGAVVILPLESPGNVFVLRQYRPAVKETLIEFPAGTLEVGEKPEECAPRELAEEIGKKAAHWQSLGTLLPAPGFCDEVQYCYFASDLSDDFAEKDEDEQIEPLVISVAEFEKLVLSGEIRDGKSIAIFTRARLMGLV